MQGEREQSPLRRSWVVIGVGAGLLLLVLVGLLSASYTALASVFGGVVLAAVVAALLRRVMRAHATRPALVVAVCVLLVVVASAVLLIPNRPSHPFPMMYTAAVHSYTLVIRPAGAESGGFVASEEADVELDPVDATGKTTRITDLKVAATITVRSRGLLLREASIRPLQNWSVTLPDGLQLSPLPLAEPNARLVARLLDAPTGSFYAARRAVSLTVLPYLDTETVTWSLADMQDEVVFAYVPSPFNTLRPLLAPFLSLTSVSQVLVSLLGIAGGSLVSMVVQPIVLGAARTQVLPALARRRKKKTPPQEGGDSPQT